MVKLITTVCIFMMVFYSTASGLQKPKGYNFDFCIPIMDREVKIDGKIDLHEWDNAGGLSTFFKLNGQMMPEQGIVYLGTDSKKLYIAVKTLIPINTDGADTSGLHTKQKERDAKIWSDDAVEIIIRNQKNNLFQFIINSQDVLYDAKDQDKHWNSSSFQSKSFSKGDWWIIEASISLEELELTEDYLYLNICRDWARSGPSTITGGKSYVDLQSMLRLAWKKDIPAVKMEEMTLTDYPHEIKNSFNIYNPGSLLVGFSTEIVLPGGKVHKKEEKKYNKSIKFSTTSPTPPLQEYSTLILGFNVGNSVLLYREIKIENQSSSTSDISAGLGDHSLLSVDNYPGARKARFNLLMPDWKGEEIAKVKIFATSPDMSQFDFVMNQTTDNTWACLIDLPRANDGKWIFDVEYVDQDGKRVFYAQKVLELDNVNWVWADNEIGMSDKIIPPFTPLGVEDNTVKSILREHVMNSHGLWKQVLSQGEEILAEAIQLDMRINGKQVKWEDVSIKKIEQTPSKVVFECISKTDSGVELKTISTFDYDGMMWVKMNLNSPTKFIINKMTINIPMKAEQCDLMHVFADSIRSNPTGYIPKGQGEVWNSKSVPKRFIDGKRLIASEFIPYIWVGGPARGICWFADSGEYFVLEDSVPAIRLKRPDSNTVVTEIDIVNKAITLNGEKNFEFGLQATPVKPQDRKAFLLNGIAKSKGVSGNQKGATNFYYVRPTTSGFTSNWSKYPCNDDYSMMRLIAETAKTGIVNQNTINQEIQKIIPSIRAHYAKYEKEYNRTYGKYREKGETIIDYGVRRVTTEIKAAFRALSAGGGDARIYSDARLAQTDSSEYLCFKSEWRAPQTVGYAAGARIYPTKSWINYILWYYKKQIESGIVGVYLDDTFVIPGFNPDIGIGGVNYDGVDEPQMGILATRELIKRIAVMQHELTPGRNYIMIHHSDALIIPAFSFANIGFTWEDKFGVTEFQDRYPLDYIRAESTGIQGGLVSFTLNGIFNNVNYPKEQWIKEFHRLTKTKMALKLLHQMKSYSNFDAHQPTVFNAEKVLFDFAAYSSESRFVPYWENSSSVKLSDDENYKASYYTREGEVLIVVSSINEAKDVKLKLDKKELGLSANAVIKDLLSNKYFKSDELELSIPRREFTFIYCGSKERADKLVSTEQRNILRSDTRIMRNDSASGRNVLESVGKWDARPGFLPNPVAKNKATAIIDEQTHAFTVNNENNSEEKGMAWATDLVAPFSLASFKGWELEYRATNISKSRRHTGVITLLPTNKQQRMMMIHELIIDSKWHKMTKFFSGDRNFTIDRMVLHTRTMPGTTSTFEIRNFKLIPE